MKRASRLPSVWSRIVTLRFVVSVLFALLLATPAPFMQPPVHAALGAPIDPVLQQRMGRVAALQGDREGQLNWLKKAFDVDRKSGEIAAELAQLATEIGDYELALKPLRAITLMENPQPVTRPMALLWEAKIEHARGNRAKAEL